MAVARYLMMCLVLVNLHIYAYAVPCEVFNLTVIVLASLLVFPMWAAVTHCCNISRFSQEENMFSNIPTYVHLPVGGHYLVILALTLR